MVDSASAPARSRRFSARDVVEGAALGIAFWCTAFAFQLLPGFTADTPGVVLFGVVGAALVALGARNALLALVTCAAALVLVVTETPLSNSLANRWIRRDPSPDSPLDAAVALSASVNPNGTMSSEALDHLLTALELVRSGKAKMLVSTTVEQQFPRSAASTAADQRRVLDILGLNPSWLQLPPTTSTRDEAVKSAEVLLPRGVRRIAVVASPMHTRRACGAFEAAGFSVTCVPALSRVPGGDHPGPWPADRLRIFGDWIYERAAAIKYEARGWLPAKT